MLNSNPVHAALSLVGTLFGIAVLFVAQEAHFLAAVQVIVYAGAIVVLFLFVLMLLGVDRAEDLSIEPLGGGSGSRPCVVGLGVLALPLARVLVAPTATPPARRPQAGDANLIDDGRADVDQLGESLFTTYLFAFEVTSRPARDRRRRRRRAGPQVKRADLIDDPLGRHEPSGRRRGRAEPTTEPEPRGGRVIAVAEVTPAWYLVLGVAPVHDRRRRACSCAATRS